MDIWRRRRWVLWTESGKQLIIASRVKASAFSCLVHLVVSLTRCRLWIQRDAFWRHEIQLELNRLSAKWEVEYMNDSGTGICRGNRPGLSWTKAWYRWRLAIRPSFALHSPNSTQFICSLVFIYFACTRLNSHFTRTRRVLPVHRVRVISIRCNVRVATWEIEQICQCSGILF